MIQTNDTARARLLALTSGYCFVQALRCAVGLGIPDELAAGARSASEIAARIQCAESDVRRLMNALCSIGIFRSAEGGRYELTSVSHHLRRDSEPSLASWALFHGTEIYEAFGKLEESMRSGVPAWDLAHGASIWEYLEAHPGRAALFDAMMHVPHAADSNELIAACELPETGLLIDVGGGDGSFMREVLRRKPRLRARVFDRADVIERASEQLVEGANADRLSTEPGDFFTKVPPGGDIYVLRHVLHDWDDDSCARILRKCSEAIGKAGRLLVVEAVLDAGLPQGWMNWADLGVMIFGGKERSLAEYREILALGGFDLVASRAAARGVCVLEGRRAPEVLPDSVPEFERQTLTKATEKVSS